MADKKKKTLSERGGDLMVAGVLITIGLAVITTAIQQFIGAAIIVITIAILVYMLIRQLRAHRRALDRAQTRNIRHDVYHHDD